MPPTLKKIIFLFIFSSCAQIHSPISSPIPKDFSKGEVILGAQLLTKIYDTEMAPLSCVPDVDEAALLVRTLAPRMERIQDDLEALLDSQADVNALIANCDQDCTCSFIDDLLQEHQVILDKGKRKILDQKKKKKDLNSCLNYIQTTFCQGELFKSLNQEKADFSFDEEAP